MKSVNHALEWKRAYESKEAVVVGTVEEQLLDTVIGYERMRAWIELGYESSKYPNPLKTLTRGLSSLMPQDIAQMEADLILTLVAAEKAGVEITVELFNKTFYLTD